MSRFRVIYILLVIAAVSFAATAQTSNVAEGKRRQTAGEDLLRQGLRDQANANTFYAKAVTEFTAGIAADPKNVFNLADRAVAYYLMTGDELTVAANLKKAVEDLNKALAIEPKYAGAMHQRGLVRMRFAENAANANELLAGFKAGLGIDAKTDVHTSEGFTITRSYDLAIADFTAAIAINDRMDDAYFDRGRSYSAKKEYGKAKADLEKVLELRPNSAGAKAELAKLPAGTISAPVTPLLIDAVIGKWKARNSVGTIDVDLDIVIEKVNGKLAGKIVSDTAGSPLELKDLSIGSGRIFSFKVYPPNGTSMSVTGTFSTDGKQMTGNSTITANGRPYPGKWTAVKK